MSIDTNLFCVGISAITISLIGYDYYSFRKRELEIEKQKEKSKIEELSNYNNYFFQRLNLILEGKHLSLKEFENYK
jgi:hypothetical protein